PLLGIGCPNIVYPYLRANIADLITRAGFPPVHLSEINFEVFYQQRLQALAAQADTTGIVGADGTAAAKH
ncbi:MAG: protein-export chaperone SecB, partial [Janthinobacterium lividum]